MKSRQVKKIVRKQIKWWLHWLGLNYGRTDIRFVEFIKDVDGPDVVGKCDTDWRYHETTITFALHKMRNFDKERIEQTVVHELMHIFLNEMREDGIDHEERVATNLQKAFFWVRDGLKDA